MSNGALKAVARVMAREFRRLSDDLEKLEPASDHTMVAATIRMGEVEVIAYGDLRPKKYGGTDIPAFGFLRTDGVYVRHAEIPKVASRDGGAL